MSERVYTTVDKSEWGPGPWQDEPDKVQWTDATTGLPCLAKRGPGGHWCGYVGISEGSPLFELDYDDARVPDDVHGGLTYAAHCAEGPEESSICHVPEPGQPDHVWWFGFDCAHAWDLSPACAARERKRYEETGDCIWLPDGDERYRDLRYIRLQVARLAEQLAFPVRDQGGGE